MKEHSDHTLSLLLKDYYRKVDGPNQGRTYTGPQSGWTQPGSNLYSPQSGRTQPQSNLCRSTKWTDPTRVKLIRVHKVDRPHQGSTPIHKVDGPNLYESTKWTDPTKGQHQSTKWTDPTRVKLIRVHKVDGPHQGSTLVHKVDGLNQGLTHASP